MMNSMSLSLLEEETASITTSSLPDDFWEYETDDEDFSSILNLFRSPTPSMMTPVEDQDDQDCDEGHDGMTTASTTAAAESCVSPTTTATDATTTISSSSTTTTTTDATTTAEALEEKSMSLRAPRSMYKWSFHKRPKPTKTCILPSYCNHVLPSFG